ncbi:hypothetical protein MNR02_00560 [Shinella sp. H4-D48]|uniref:hypothetical protein n=1 Tax=Shinella sp. H4-D48 TaxID=2925841 RepID=UPI001F531AA2|nr:hypothetical protein [Shinella sp. H4-D48]UNK38238.1 hypothetical protein MNR02_00560 [Shinella sp. H4-D48]
MSKRVLHAAYQRYFSPGISAQMYQEQQAADELGIVWHSRLFTSESHVSTDVVCRDLSSDGAAKSDFYSWLTRMSEDYDIVLLRHLPADYGEFCFLKRSKIPVLLMHHTLEVPELIGSLNVKSLAKAAIEAVVAPQCIRQAYGIVSVTEEIAQYQIQRSGFPMNKSIVYPNGIRMDGSIAHEDGRTGAVPRLIFVSSYFHPWQGLDRVIYSARSFEEDFVVDVVGDVHDNDARAAFGDARFVFHGALDNKRVAAMLSKSWLALSSFALDRKNMKQACTLKVRQYLSHGVPVYATHLDVFPRSFPYFKVGSCNLSDMVDFAKNMRFVSREDVRKTSRPYIDKTILLRGCYERLMALDGL